MQKIIEYFSEKHIFTNLLFISVFVAAIIFWNNTNKEEMPNLTFDRIRISASYPGATAEEVEYFVTKEIEEALEGIDGIENIRSTSSAGSCSVSVELEPDNPNRDDVIIDIKDAVDSVKLPDDIENDPRVREFKSSRKAIIDIVLYYNGADILTNAQRDKLQTYSDTLEDKLLSLSSISEVGGSGYLDEYIEIQLIPERLSYYNIPISEVISAIKKNNIKQPVGTLDDELSTKIRLDDELDSIEKIKNVTIQASFEGKALKLIDVARVIRNYEDRGEILKVNGSEALRMTVTKTSKAGILEAVDQVKVLTDQFSNTVLKNSNVSILTMDDESVSVRDRLSLISMNGIFGFILILILLFVFLDSKSGLWVAMGIPFTFGFAMIFASLLGHTINNITLAAVIIVMGMVVDDAIVVAENISRLRSMGVPPGEAVSKGTAMVLMPIVASITTTCAAFIPLFFFSGRFGMLIEYIPPIIFLMLAGSLFEAIFILPSHLRYEFPRWVRVVFSLGLLPVIEKHYARKKKDEKLAMKKVHWFESVENIYEKILRVILKFKLVIFISFVVLLLISGWIFVTQMKYSMFPREETAEVVLSGIAPQGTLKYDTEKLVRPVEDIFIEYLDKEVKGFITNVSRGRRGREARENVFSMVIEIVSKEDREKSSNELIAEWEEKIKDIVGFEELKFSKSRWGHSSGSPIDIIIKENDNYVREKVAEELVVALEKMPSLINPEVERQLKDPEYQIKLNKELASRLSISTDTIGTNLRTILEGNNIYDISEGGRDIEVMVTVPSWAKKDINSVLNMPIQNRGNYLVPLKNIVTVNKTVSPNSIEREDGKRVLHVFADLNEKGLLPDTPKGMAKEDDYAKTAINDDIPEVDKYDILETMTPLEIAEFLEANVFPDIISKYPTTVIDFDGEIKDTRESTGDFTIAIILVIILIYVILALTLNSLTKPFIIMLSIPFGCVGIIFALKFHGMSVYGFFSAIGALGLAGVVVNDSIVLLAKLEREYNKNESGVTPLDKVASISKTRLRAVLLTTITTVVGLLPTAYGFFGYDSMLAEMMLTMSWGLMFGTLITLVLVPLMYCTMKEGLLIFKRLFNTNAIEVHKNS